ncbi:MAG: NADH-quinone oxidoreductase subunit J [Nitrospina sp.]|jgi:NADH-quinone oxidoreductase subunit J|nr:NADH-quinone oxidoreductase subunit J [Nitrospina sp.]MBT3509535.1 NADH-quinone oxidoreductase subunit J [Nitrospina sp.]MBT3876861.1 NADH-quinone oxidoreductase subunit J [Nitrospina sp.]MBT4049059.1 NADH-quinone oxidoreductase subunit J [Nitrospina sp.]MBT4556386.1 NADH-quinone oxidoreductase subunit J [Nitrospina sp.]
MELLIFYPLAGFCVVLALGVVFNNSPVGSALSLIGMMLGLAGIFVLQQAHFIAILQVIIYAGAIMVLFMFVIMLLNLKKGDDMGWVARDKNLLLSVLTGVLAIGILYKISDILFSAKIDTPATLPDSFGTVANIGETLFTDFVLPFEVASILLLAAMVGAVVLAKNKLD